MRKLTKKQASGIATAIAIVAGTVTPVALKMWPEQEYVETLYAGMPISTNHWVILSNHTYTVAYDLEARNPAWVAYRLYRTDGDAAPKRPSKFKPDRRLQGATQHDDYTDTGFDRGHMAPSYGIAVCYGKAGQKETFLMSNVVPQTPGMNRGPWRFLEEAEAKEWTQGGSVWVITGPLYGDDPDTLPSGIKVPEAFWKVLLREHGTNSPPLGLAFIVPQRVLMKDSYTNFVTTVDEVEEITGIDFFAELPDNMERIIEAENTIW